MSVDEESSLTPLASVDGEPPFAEPWQAQVLAIADALIQRGLFSASAWSNALGAALSESRIKGDPDNQETYYRCALGALERLATGQSEIDAQSLAQRLDDWRIAYRSTPHGQPVTLKATGSRGRGEV